MRKRGLRGVKRERKAGDGRGGRDYAPANNLRSAADASYYLTRLFNTFVIDIICS